LRDLLESRVNRFAERWLSQDAFSGCNAVLFDWQVDNFGLFGTAALFTKLGMSPPADAAFEGRARARVAAEEEARLDDWRKQRFFFKERVYCYTEFVFSLPGLAGAASSTNADGGARHLLKSSILKENSFLGEGTRAGRTGLLRALSLPISELVDRSLCAEFQALSELCDLLDGAGVVGQVARRFVTGSVVLWTTGASCLSCVGCMRQFLLLFPGIRMEVLCAARC